MLDLREGVRKRIHKIMNSKTAGQSCWTGSWSDIDGRTGLSHNWSRHPGFFAINHGEYAMEGIKDETQSIPFQLRHYVEESTALDGHGQRHSWTTLEGRKR